MTEEEQLISDTMVKMLDFTIEMLQQAQEQLKVGDMAGSIQCTMMAAAFLQELLSPAEGDPQPSQAAISPVNRRLSTQSNTVRECCEASKRRLRDSSGDGLISSFRQSISYKHTKPAGAYCRQ